MIKIIDWLISLDWNTILASWGISGVTMFAWFQYIVNKGTDFHFSKRLKKYERDLQDITENTKFEYQRKLSDFNLYTAKKHEHYILLYEDILIAYGNVSHLTSALKMRSSYTWYNEDDMKEYLKKLSLPKGKIEELTRSWVSDKSTAEKEIYKCVTLKEEFDTENSISKMRNLYWKSQLYLSEELSNKIKLLNEQLFELFLNCKDEYKEYEEPKERIARHEKNKKLKEIIDNDFNEVVGIMKEELAVGYYPKKQNTRD